MLLQFLCLHFFGATIGGSLAARGSGVVSTKYGKAEDLVLQIEAVMANGTVIDTLPVPSHASGPPIVAPKKCEPG